MVKEKQKTFLDTVTEMNNAKGCRMKMGYINAEYFSKWFDMKPEKYLKTKLLDQSSKFYDIEYDEFYNGELSSSEFEQILKRIRAHLDKILKIHFQIKH
ncbi:hypothetical protein NPIL_514221 [Nephila pilipes]|uniref:Uncharacterized protein n=1 Tax=Nephila pilipes TaxID=299642 RepID=A0A8X6Q7H5_NEPPI|nr:hypothetical protein NPIL_514221 [Nephila pilipes]